MTEWTDANELLRSNLIRCTRNFLKQSIQMNCITNQLSSIVIVFCKNRRIEMKMRLE